VLKRQEMQQITVTYQKKSKQNGSALGQAQKQGKVKLVNQIPTLLPLKTGSSMAIQI
jgi:hypothetical protein